MRAVREEAAAAATAVSTHTANVILCQEIPVGTANAQELGRSRGETRRGQISTTTRPHTAVTGATATASGGTTVAVTTAQATTAVAAAAAGRTTEAGCLAANAATSEFCWLLYWIKVNFPSKNALSENSIDAGVFFFLL